MQKPSTNVANKPQSNDNVAWHDFTLKELLKISKQNSWNDVNKDVTTLILSLSKYNPTKTQNQKNTKTSPNSLNSIDKKDDNKTETDLNDDTKTDLQPETLELERLRE
eukprot:892627_1